MFRSIFAVIVKADGCLAQCRSSGAVRSINEYMRSPWYVVLIAALTALSSVFGLDLFLYSAFILTGIFICLFGHDLLPVMPIVICCYVAPSVSNNPGRNENSIFYPENGGIYLIGIAVLFALCLLFRLVADPKLGRKRFLSTKRELAGGMILLGIAYLLSGIGIEAYSSYFLKNLLFAVVQFAAVFVMYYLFTGAVDWARAPKDYLAWIGLCVGFVVLVQLAENYLSGRAFMEGGSTIDRELMATGWGMHNNIGGLMAMMMPFPFYFAYTRRRGWIYTALATVLMIGVVASCSRTSMAAAAAVFIICSALLCRKPEKRKPILVFYAAAAVGLLVFAIASFDRLAEIFALFIEEIGDVSKRDLLFINGMKQFREYPIFGGTFYPQGEFVPWDWADLEAFSSFFPPRWHNTLVQIAASCGIVGLVAYGIHRVQTVRLFMRSRSPETLFVGLFVMTLLVAGLLDNHFFNVGPVLFYSMALAFVEKIHLSKQ